MAEPQRWIPDDAPDDPRRCGNEQPDEDEPEKAPNPPVPPDLEPVIPQKDPPAPGQPPEVPGKPPIIA